MLRLRLDAARLVELGARRHLPLREVDLGYLVHAQLGETFGTLAPRPFSISPAQGRQVTVLAYSQRPAAELRVYADSFADPALHATIDWARFDDKRMPASWPEGKRLGFMVRACPVVRAAKATDRHTQGAEVDAFLARCWALGPEAPVEREAVYRDWLGRELGRGGAAELVTVRLTGFQRDRVLRRTHSHDRRAAICERPAASLAGVLTVGDGAAFGALLARGVGRHRAFGFGLLLLRPAPAGC
jgi:CRISPR system Cascade subunit CasE